MALRLLPCFCSLQTQRTSSSSSLPLSNPSNASIISLPYALRQSFGLIQQKGHDRAALFVSCGTSKEDTSAGQQQQIEESAENVSAEDLEYVRQIQRVLELLKKNRDMLFGEVKLTIMIEDPRDIERKRLLGIEDPDEVTRDDLAAALEDIHEGRIPENRDALRLLAKEMTEWPDLEAEVPKSKKPSRSLYARATDTGVDPKEAARRLNIDWDSAADVEVEDEDDDVEVPPVVGYSALYLVTALPIIIGVSVVLILFYNSLQ